jgi:hypothetical protein
MLTSAESTVRAIDKESAITRMVTEIRPLLTHKMASITTG